LFSFLVLVAIFLLSFFFFFFFLLFLTSNSQQDKLKRLLTRKFAGAGAGGGWLFFVERVLLKVAHGCARSIRIWKFPVAGGGRRIQIWCEIIIHEGNAPHQTRNNTKEKPTHNLLYMYTAIISLSTTT
jgi:hypothetical protein